MADTPASDITAEAIRLAQDAARTHNWKRWGPYLSDRQWATVREDYSADGNPWSYFPHDHARSRAYRWGEDGLLGVTDRQCRLCLAPVIWNGNDPILKERLFGLTGPEGNHGEDVKECYFFLDSTPTHSYLKALYRYPQRAFPYDELVRVNRARSRDEPEYELLDTGVFNENRFFDLTVEYAKAGPDDLLARFTVTNHGPEAAPVWLLPTLWFRNTWIWGCKHEGCTLKPDMRAISDNTIRCEHQTLGSFTFHVGAGPDGKQPALLFTENETNTRKLFGSDNYTPFVKDAFHRLLVDGEKDAVNPKRVGTKVAALYHTMLAPGASVTVKMRLTITAQDIQREPLGDGFDRVFADRIAEADAFYAARPAVDETDRTIDRQACAGLLWSKQFYHFVQRDWLAGDSAMPLPPEERKHGRNADWGHLFSRDVLSMPDTWEYPWFAAWDTAFHMIPMCRLDPEFAKSQLLLLLREWYMHPNGQMPAYEFNFSDVNPPVHAWACWRVYKMTAPKGKRDTLFLARAFQKLMLNFTWWVNRKDVDNRHVFSGGFLGLDNIGLFDRSQPLPGGGRLDQADGTAWMAFYCTTMLAMATELAMHDKAYEDIASKFFEHFVGIADAMNHLGGSGLWDEQDGFYYDKLSLGSQSVPLRVRSLVGLIPMLAVEVLEHDVLSALPGFAKRVKWFLENRSDLAMQVTYMDTLEAGRKDRHLLAIPSPDRLKRLVARMLDESEFLSPHGLRSLSKAYEIYPYHAELAGANYRIAYEPGESRTEMFGGNSNWRGPVWLPVNYLLIEALERYHYFYGDSLMIEHPTGSGRKLNLKQIAADLSQRLLTLFTPDASGHRPCHGEDARFTHDPLWRDLLLFHEYFHGDTGKGLGASHQTGWTALVTRCVESRAAATAAKKTL
jgi:hypothetical protein